MTLPTRRQSDVLNFIIVFIRERGYAPTYEDIGRELGLRSLATVWKHVEALRVKGLLAHHKFRRDLRPVNHLGTCPLCGSALEAK